MHDFRMKERRQDEVNPYRFKDYPSMEQDKPALVSDIAAEFREDRTEALEHYSHKRMVIKGVVTYAGPDVFGLPSLELSDHKGGENVALCVFNEESSIQDIKEGDAVAILANFIDCVPDYGLTFKKCGILERRKKRKLPASEEYSVPSRE